MPAIASCRSAPLLMFVCHVCQPKELIEKIRRLLGAAIANSTPVHLTAGASGSDDEHFFLDFETAILGSAPSDYADFAAKMRDEYGFMPDLDYLQLRLKVRNQ